jgi:MFS family permease
VRGAAWQPAPARRRASILAAFLIPEWHLSGAQAGLLAGSGAAGYMLTVPVLATLTDRIDARKILIAGSALSALGTLLFGLFATGLWSGACSTRSRASALPAPICRPQGADRPLAPGDSSRAITLYTSSFSFGVGLSFLVSQLVAEAWGWRSASSSRRSAAGDAAVCLLLRPVEAEARAGACWISRRCSATPSDGFRARLRRALLRALRHPDLDRRVLDLCRAKNSDASILTPIVVSVCSRCSRCPRAFSAMNSRSVRPPSRHLAVMFASAAWRC